MKLFTLFLILATALAFGQDGLPKKTHAKIETTAPVTSMESAEALAQAEKIVKQMLQQMAPSVFGPDPSTKPTSREQIVAGFAKLVSVAKPAMKVDPMPVKFDEKRVKIGSSAKKALLDLIRNGYVAPFGPLATNPSNTLTPAEYGDALGQLLCRISELTHTPSIRWTPILQNIKRT
jgi:hypothetical protein